MKKTVILISMLIAVLAVQAQDWVEVNQKYFGIKYRLPDSWEIDGFGGNDWESYGSSVCECAGTINIGNRFDDDEIFMVVYPTKFKDSLDIEKRRKVWDMVFDSNGEKSQIKTKNCTFEKIISKWTDGTAGKRKGWTVWQLKTNYKNKQYYVMYFWAKPEVMKNNEDLLMQILNSIKLVRS